VLAHLEDQPQQALSPTAIAKQLDRSAGAVANARGSWPAKVRSSRSSPSPAATPSATPAMTTATPSTNAANPSHKAAVAPPRPRRRPARQEFQMPRQPNPGEQPPDAAAEELLAMVAHELRRPLTALLGALAIVQQRGAALPPAQQRELLAIARRQGAHLQQLLDQLLAAYQPEAAMGQWPLVDLAGLVQEVGTTA
jgi:hypothetical protein